MFQYFTGTYVYHLTINLLKNCLDKMGHYSYVVYKNNKISFSDWLKIVSKDELRKVYEELRLQFCKTGIKSYEMQKIGEELGEREAKEWFKNHPPNINPNFRWTDANRWDKD